MWEGWSALGGEGSERRWQDCWADRWLPAQGHVGGLEHLLVKRRCLLRTCICKGCPAAGALRPADALASQHNLSARPPAPLACRYVAPDRRGGGVLWFYP